MKNSKEKNNAMAQRKLFAKSLQRQRRNLHVTVDVETIVFACQDDRSVVQKSNIETLGVLDLRFESRDKLPVLSEYGQVEVVVIVGDEDFAGRVDAHANGIIGETFAANLPQEDAFVAKYLDAVSAVV